MKQLIIHTANSVAGMQSIWHLEGELFNDDELHVIAWPEGFGGPQMVVEEIAEALREHPVVVVLTMYPDAVNFAGELVYHKMIDAAVIVHDGNTVNTYEFDEDGVLTEDWPFGFLTYESSDVIRELKGLH